MQNKIVISRSVPDGKEIVVTILDGNGDPFCSATIKPEDAQGYVKKIWAVKGEIEALPPGVAID